MSQPARPLRIVIVSPETGVLHDLAWMLSAVGYKVVTSKDLSEHAAWRQFTDTDFLIFDGRSISAPTPATLAHHSDIPIYRFFLYDSTATVDFTSWFAAGANDALRVPVSRGELLVRMRVGARMLEFENRARGQSLKSRLPGMLSVNGLLRKLRKLSTEKSSAAAGHTLLTMSVDFFAGLCRREGESAARQLVETLANSIGHSTGGNALAAYLDNGTFHLVLPGRKAAAARAIAEQIEQSFRADQLDREPHARLSLTTAIVPWQAGVSPEKLLEQGQETLAIAQQSGGGCAIEQNAFAQELTSWQNELTIGSPFANVIAQDVMEPFPYLLEQHAASQAKLAALRRSGAPVWPFVDREGRLVGVSTPDSTTDGSSALDQHPNGRHALTKPITIAHNAAFPEIYELFSTEGCMEMIVVADDQPIGYITFSGFISLIEPINTATFSSDEPVLDDSRSMLVGSLVSGTERAFGSDQ
jgi:GGDEF domain-containing protein